ncbi:hypothetical protein NKI72_31295 [Mesorhizobium sp. M0437]|uniref:hypothetical protein n=1 Tax=Mesorhizobium sp. M0437 TaxID=2956945 RepID=UPI003335AE79
MTYKGAVYTFIFGLSSAIVTLPAKAECQLSEAMLPIQESIQSLQDNIEDGNVQLQTLSNKLVDESAQLRSLLPRPPKGVPASFCTSLAGLGSLLGQAAVKPDLTIPIIQSVADDLSLKVAFLTKNLALDSLRYAVSVTVSTKLSGSEVSGYIISANPLIYEDNAEPLFAFPQLSSPTTMDLPPGKYSIAASKEGKASCKRQLDVGGNGEKALNADCPLQ